MKLNFIQIALIVTFFVLTTNGFAYTNWTKLGTGPIVTMMYLLFFLIFFLSRSRGFGVDFLLGKTVKWLIITPLFSLFVVQFYFGESVWNIKREALVVSIYLLYFLFTYFHVKPEILLKSFFIIGLFVLFLQVYQQFIPKDAMFGLLTEDEMLIIGSNTELSMRNDLYRFRFDAFFYISFISLYFSWQKLREHFSVKYMLLFICFAISIYMYLARQIMAVALFVIFMSLLNNVKKAIFVILLLIVVVTYFSSVIDNLFGELLSQTSDELSSDYIRYFEYIFFAEKIFSSPIVTIFGNGILSQEIVWAEVYHYFTADIGVVGTVYHYGFLWFFVYIYFFYFFFKKCWAFSPLYIRMFIFTILVDSIFITPMERASFLFVFTSALYIIQYHYMHSSSSSIMRSESK